MWDYCAALGLGNTNVNIGVFNSIKIRARVKNENLIVKRCPCHMLHNLAEKAGLDFTDVSNFNVSDHCLDLYHWFHKSSK